LNGATVIGMPAILGMYNTGNIISHLESLLEVKVFEIPTIPPSLPGIRMKEAFETQISQKGVRLFHQKRVLHVRQNEEKRFVLEVGDMSTGKVDHIIESDGIILASGRFLGMGLHAGRKKITEAIFDLPVTQPDERSKWHQKDFFDVNGHQINQAGIEIDAFFRPLDKSGQPAFENLFAAGSILAHQDWMRQKCGAGLAISSAYAAVKAFGKAVK
jgi:glycerol-3-phosphate dehydrogenase subunit B